MGRLLAANPSAAAWLTHLQRLLRLRHDCGAAISSAQPEGQDHHAPTAAQAARVGRDSLQESQHREGEREREAHRKSSVNVSVAASIHRLHSCSSSMRAQLLQLALFTPALEAAHKPPAATAPSTHTHTQIHTCMTHCTASSRTHASSHCRSTATNGLSASSWWV